MSIKHLVAVAATLCACSAPVGPTGVNNANPTGTKQDNPYAIDLAYAPYDMSLPTEDLAYSTTDLATQACGTVTAQGMCVGNLVEYCAGGVLQTQDCGATGGTCTTGAFGPSCTSGGTMPGGGSCGAVTENGTCMGNTLEFCDAGMLQTVDCTPYGGCFVDMTGWADCAN